MQLCFASRNLHKIGEVKAQLPAHIEVLSLDDIGCETELPETTDTIEGNSLQKAQYVWDHYQLNCFADDSGLEVKALRGEPGVDSAHYSGKRDAQANMDLLLEKLISAQDRNAHFKTVFTLILEGAVHQFTGLVEGEIISQKRGEEGFGYDPIFLPKGYERTFAQMSMQEKNQISHRARALKQLIHFLENL